jgi:hypothetical protein
MVFIQGELRHFPKMAGGTLKKCIDTFCPRALFSFFWEINSPEVAVRFKALNAPARLFTNCCGSAPNNSK